MKSSQAMSRTNEMYRDRRSEPVLVGELQIASTREAVGDDHLPERSSTSRRGRGCCCLRVFRKSSRKPTSAESDHHAEHEHARRSVGRLARTTRCADEVAEDRADDEDDAAHRGRAALDVVGLRPVVADELAPAEPREQPDEQRRQEQRESERRTPPAIEEGDHANHSPQSVAQEAQAGRLRRLHEHDVARARSSSRSRSYASSASATSTDSPSHEPSRPAAMWMCRAPSPTTTSLPMFEPHREPADAVVLLAGELAELGHLAEHGDRALPGR